MSESDESPVLRFARDAARATLGGAADAAACVSLVALVNGMLDQARDSFEQGGASLACRAGCAFCCHLRVMIFPHEAIALAHALRTRMPVAIAARVRARLDERTRQGEVDAPARSTACAFLVEGLCSAYEARPSACAGFHSVSRQRCEENHERGPSAMSATPVLQSLQYVATQLDAGLAQALEDAGLGATRMELHAAVVARLRAGDGDAPPSAAPE